jgi:dihydroxyacetone kinase-like predicted kinase
VDGALVAVSNSPADALNEVLSKLDLNQTGVITLYFGADTGQAEAEAAGASIRERYPQLEVEVVRGSQPHYNYIGSVE